MSCPLPPAAPSSHGHGHAIRPRGLDRSVAASSPKPQHCGVLCPSHCVPHTSGCGLCSTPPSSHLAHRADSIFLWSWQRERTTAPWPLKLLPEVITWHFPIRLSRASHRVMQDVKEVASFHREGCALSSAAAQGVHTGPRRTPSPAYLLSSPLPALLTFPPMLTAHAFSATCSLLTLTPCSTRVPLHSAPSRPPLNTLPRAAGICVLTFTLPHTLFLSHVCLHSIPGVHPHSHQYRALRHEHTHGFQHVASSCSPAHTCLLAPTLMSVHGHTHTHTL